MTTNTMRMSLRAALCLVAFAVTSVLSVGSALAAPQTGAAVDNGAFVVMGQPPVNGAVSFTFGWNNSNQFAVPAAGFWLGIYDVTNSHYVWASDTRLPQTPTNGQGTLDWTSLRMVHSDVPNLAPGDYTINFFVRGSYEPASNVAVVQLNFTVR